MRRARKITKLRGHRYCGKGYNDRSRNKGSHGGKGNAGSKDHKRLEYLKLYGPSYFGKERGFKNKNPSFLRALNVSELERLCIEKKLKEVNLEELGYAKLLGAGTIKTALKISAHSASPRAVDKVKAAGGSVNIQKVEEHPEGIRSSPEPSKKASEKGVSKTPQGGQEFPRTGGRSPAVRGETE